MGKKKKVIAHWEIIMTTTEGERIPLDTYELSDMAGDLVDELITEQGYKTDY